MFIVFGVYPTPRQCANNQTRMTNTNVGVFACSLCGSHWGFGEDEAQAPQPEFRGVCFECISGRKLTARGIDNAIAEYAEGVDAARTAVGD